MNAKQVRNVERGFFFRRGAIVAMACVFAGVLGVAGANAAETTIRVADLNNDGLLDVVTGNRVTGEVSVYLASGQDNFEPPETHAINHDNALAIADLDGDGSIDIAIASATAPMVRLLRNRGDGSFESGEAIAPDDVPDILLPLRSTVDGAAAIITCSGAVTQASIIEDAFGERSVTPIDVRFSWEDFEQTLLLSLGTSCPRYQEGDVNGDGVVDTTDLEIVLVNLCDEEPQPLPAWAICDTNDFVEPGCNPNSQGDGIQSCMEAVACRATLCHWAACMEYHSGGTLAYWIGQNLACGAVADLEFAGCLTVIIPL